MSTCTETIYIESAENNLIRLERIEQIIAALEIRALAVIGNSDVEEYEINDGQVKIKTIYRSSESIAKAIMAYQKIANTLLNKLNGRDMVLRDWRGLM